MQEGVIRGRPKGQLTRAKRKVLAFVIAKQAANENYTKGELMRACGFEHRWNANRVLKQLRAMGMI